MARWKHCPECQNPVETVSRPEPNSDFTAVVYTIEQRCTYCDWRA